MGITLRDSLDSSTFTLNPVANSVSNAYSAGTANEFQRGWQSSAIGEDINSLYTEAAKAEAAGRMDIAQQYLDRAELRKRDAAAWRPEVDHIQNINNAGDFMSFAAQGLGAGLHSTMPSILGGVAGMGLARAAAARLPLDLLKGGAPSGLMQRAGQAMYQNPGAAAFAGASVPAYNMEMEEAVGQAMQEDAIRGSRSAQEIIDTGRVKGFTNMALEAAAPSLMAGRLGGAGLRKAIPPTGALGTTAAGIGRGVLEEGLTEGTQSIVGQVAQNQLARRELGDIDWMDVANEAAVGGISGGGMGVIGGAADAAYGAARWMGDQAVDAANSDATRGAVRGAGALAGKGIQRGVEALGEAAGAVGGHVGDITDAYKDAGGGANGVVAGLSTVEDKLMRGASDVADATLGGYEKVKKSLNERLAEAAGVEDVDEVINNLGTNPFADRTISEELGLKQVDDNGRAGMNVLRAALQDQEFTKDLSPSTMSQLNELAADKDAWKYPKKQAQIQLLMRQRKDNVDTAQTFSKLFEDFSAIQEATGKAFPSKQMTLGGKERYDSVTQYLNAVGISDKTMVSRLAGAAATGNTLAFDMAVNKELLGKGVLDPHTPEGKKVLDTLRTLGSPVEEVESEAAPTTKSKMNRADRRAAQAKRDPFTASKISEYVSSVVAGTEKDTLDVKMSVAHAIHALISGLKVDKINLEDIKKFRAAVTTHLGERGGELMDTIASMYEHGSTDSKVKARAAAMRSKDGEQSALSGIDKLMTTQHAPGKRAAAVHDVLRQLSKAYANGINAEVADNFSRARALRADAKRLRDTGDLLNAAKATKLDNKAYELESADPYQEFNDLLDKHFKAKDHGRVEQLVGAHLGQVRKEMKPSAPTRMDNAGTGSVNEADYNEDDQESVDPSANDLDPEDAEIAKKQSLETGHEADNKDEPTRFWGQTGKNLGKYEDYPGAPLTLHATYDHPQGEEAAVRRLVEEKYNGARINNISVGDWAKRRAKETGQSEDQLLNDAAAAQYEQDLDQREKLSKLLEKSDNQLARREGNSDVKGSDVRARAEKQLEFTELRIKLYEAVGGNGQAFFGDRLTRNLRYVMAEPATGKILGIDKATLERHLVRHLVSSPKRDTESAIAHAKAVTQEAKESAINVATEEAMKRYGISAEDFRRSLIDVKLADGTVMKLDLAGLVGEMISRNQETEIFGAGDKAVTAGFLENIKFAYMNTMASLYTSDLLSNNDPFNARGGEQAGFSRNGFNLAPGKVIYRESGKGGRVYNYGQVFGTKGETAARAQSIKAVEKDLRPDEVESIVHLYDKKRPGGSATNRHIAKNVMTSADGRSFDINVHQLLKAMMERHGMRSDEIIPQMDASDGVSYELAGALLKDGFELLKRQYGLTPNSDLSNPSWSNSVLWEFEKADGETVPVTFSQAANHVFKEYKGTYDYRSDKLQKARAQLQSKLDQYRKARIEFERDSEKAPSETELNALEKSIEQTLKYNEEVFYMQVAVAPGYNVRKTPDLGKRVKTRSTSTNVGEKKADLAKTKDGEMTVFDVGADESGIQSSSQAQQGVGGVKEFKTYVNGAPKATSNNQIVRDLSKVDAKENALKELEERLAAEMAANEETYDPSNQEATVSPVNFPGQKPIMKAAPKATLTTEVVDTAANQTFRNTKGSAATARAKLHAERAAKARQLKEERRMARSQESVGEEAVEAPVTRSAPKMTADDVLDAVSGLYSINDVNAAVSDLIKSGSLPSSVEIARAANKMFGAGNWPLGVKRLIKKMDETDPNGPGGGVKFSRQSTKGGLESRGKVRQSPNMGQAEKGATNEASNKEILEYYARTKLDEGDDLYSDAVLDKKADQPPGTEDVFWGKESSFGPFHGVVSLSAYDESEKTLWMTVSSSEVYAQANWDNLQDAMLDGALQRLSAWPIRDNVWGVLVNGPMAGTTAWGVAKKTSGVSEIKSPDPSDSEGYTHLDGIPTSDVNDMLAELRRRITRLQNGRVPNIQMVRHTGAKVGKRGYFPSDVVKRKFSKQLTGAMSQYGYDKLHEDVKRRFGEAVNLLVDDLGGITGMFDPKQMLIKIATDPHSIDGALGHESLHALFEMLRKHGGENGQKIIDTIIAAASREDVVQWIKQQLLARGETLDGAAVAQLSDPEERAAFLLQFYVENDGKITLPPRQRSMIMKMVDFVKRLAGITDELIRTQKFFEYFDNGTFADNFKNPENIIEGLGITRREAFVEKLNTTVKPLKDLAFAAFGHSVDRIRAMKNEHYNKIVDALQNGRDGYAGYIKEQHARQYQFANEYTDIMHGVDPKTMSDETKQKLQAFITRVEQYRKDSGAKGWDLARKNFPPAFDIDKIEGKLKEFRADLRGYGGLESESDEFVDKVINDIMYDGFSRQRKDLFRDHPEKLSKWASDDINKQAYLYIKQSTKDAEKAKAFAETSLGDLLKEGDAIASPYERQTLRTYLDAAMGTSSMSLNPQLRQLFGSVITGINVSLLPFAVFSQMLEPLQLAFRKNDLSSTLDTAFRGFTDLPRSFESVDGGWKKDQWENMARTLGTVTDAASVSMISEIMNEIPTRGKVDKINQLFFRYNGMEQWSRSMHVAATKNAIEFLLEHKAGDRPDSARLLKELGITAADIDTLEDGSLNIENPKMRSAVLKFVNESMAHPDAGSNTIWMNDARFALLAHLKRFTFGFAYYINSRAMKDLVAGRYKQLAPLALAVPWMVAVDGLKTMVTPADDAYKADWGVAEYTAQGIERSSLIGRYGVPLDIAKNMAHGGSAIEAISPAAEMTGKLARGAAQGRGLETFFEKLMPGHQLVPDM